MKYRLDLNPEPDGYGFLYGQLIAGDECFIVNIMPPKKEWRGDMRLDSERGPHATDWVLYIDGEEFARLAKREDIEASLDKFLSPLGDKGRL